MPTRSPFSSGPQNPTFIPRARTLVSRYVIGIIGVLIIGGSSIGTVLTRELEEQESHRRAEQLLQSLRYSLRFDLLSGNIIMTEERLSSLLNQGFKDHACVIITEPGSSTPVLRMGPPKICAGNLTGLTTLKDALYYDSEGQQPAYSISLRYANIPLSVPIPKFVVGSALALLLIVFFAVSQMSRALGQIFDRLLSITSAARLQDLPHEPDPIHEVEKVRLAALRLKEQENERLKVEIKRAEVGAIQAIQAQVAHDVRSPLSALASIEKDLDPLPEETRILIRSSVTRIQDIANQLILRNRPQLQQTNDSATSTLSFQQNAPTQEAPSTVLMEPLFGLLVSEKRLQYRSKLGLQIDLIQEPSAFGAFVDIHPSELRRALSNLIDNAVEATNYVGQVQIRLSMIESELRIQIEDKGKGIPPEILPTLGQWGISYDKVAGNGLGLAHAFEWVKRWKGRIAIQSEVNAGTILQIHLPLAHPPRWFASVLSLSPLRSTKTPQIVILDDDASIHQIWRTKLEGEGKLLHFSRTIELEKWVRENPDLANEAHYLVDYEIIGDSATGLSAIENLGLQKRSILVTSHFEDKEIVDHCLKLGVSILPKPLAAFIPVRHTPKRAVLVDDDPLMHMTWKKAATQAGVELISFSNSKEALSVVETLEKDSPIYVDVQLGTDDFGPDLAQKLLLAGFREVHLVTGLPIHQVPHVPGVKSTGGKNPPF